MYLGFCPHFYLPWPGDCWAALLPTPQTGLSADTALHSIVAQGAVTPTETLATAPTVAVTEHGNDQLYRHCHQR